MSKTALKSMIGHGTAILAAAMVVVVPALADAPPGRYTIATDTVFDVKTKLTWQRSASATTYTLSDARSIVCTSGWRLPTYKELLTIVDYGRANPAIDPAFLSTPSAPFWTISFAPGQIPLQGFEVNFANGGGGYTDGTNLYYVRCVR